MGGDSVGASALPVHTVELSDFWISEYPITQDVWESIMGEGKNFSNFKGKQRPIENIRWIEIVEL